MPPPHLRLKVAGSEDADWFSKSGLMSLNDLSRGLAAIGRSLDEFDDILDWGCGCGRILRHLPRGAAARRICGFDIDAEALAWVAENLPWIETSRTDGLPPTSYPDASFDLVYNHSVMTHLDASYQDAWLRELRRILRPLGIATLTVHGQHVFQQAMKPFPPEIRAMHATNLRTQGIVFFKEDSNGGFPDFYQSSFNDVRYVFHHWARFLNVRCYIPQGALSFQDLVVLERPAENAKAMWIDPVEAQSDEPAPAAGPFSGLGRRGTLRLGLRLLREAFRLRRRQ